MYIDTFHERLARVDMRRKEPMSARRLVHKQHVVGRDNGRLRLLKFMFMTKGRADTNLSCSRRVLPCGRLCTNLLRDRSALHIIAINVINVVNAVFIIIKILP
jgi:hypothetical protein